MSKNYSVPAEETRCEMLVSNSRFIASLAPAFSVEEAREFIRRIRHEFSDATHNVPVYLIGFGQSVTAHSSDDGEPSGTAGRPALAVLQGSGFGDVAVVITRYFGGTKLGTGGLVRAYSEAVRQVVSATPRAIRVMVDVVLLSLPYNLFDRVINLVSAIGGEVEEREFGADITLTLKFREGLLERFTQELSEMSAGTLSPLLMEQKEMLVRQNSPDY
jgi:uncharacterized YigZ family protein